MKKAFLQLHVAVFLAGFTAVLGKLIQLNEGLLVWYRLLLSILFIGGSLVIRKKFQRISWKGFREIAFVGLILALHWLTFYGSVKYANASVAVVCISAAGFFSAIIEPVLYKKKIVYVELFLGVLSMIGIYIIFDFHPQYQLGIIFGILSAVGSASFPIFNKRLLDKHSPEVLTLYEFAGGLIMLSIVLPFYFVYFKPEYFLPNSNDWLWLLALALFCTVFAFELQLNALKKISAFTSNLTYNLEPLYGIVLAFLVFKENKMLNSHFYIGLFLIVLSIALQMIRVMKLKVKIQK